MGATTTLPRSHQVLQGGNRVKFLNSHPFNRLAKKCRVTPVCRPGDVADGTCCPPPVVTYRIISVIERTSPFQRMLGIIANFILWYLLISCCCSCCCRPVEDAEIIVIRSGAQSTGNISVPAQQGDQPSEHYGYDVHLPAANVPVEQAFVELSSDMPQRSSQSPRVHIVAQDNETPQESVVQPIGTATEAEPSKAL